MVSVEIKRPTTEDTLWTYWQPGEIGTPPIVYLMLESITRHNPNVVILNDDLVRQLGGQEVLDNTARRKPGTAESLMRRSDLLRFWLLREFGGAWLDADYICFRPANLLEPLSDPDAEFVARLNGKRLASNAIASRKGGKLVQEAYGLAKELIRRGGRLRWNGTGPEVIRSLAMRPDISPTVRTLPHNQYDLPGKEKKKRIWTTRRTDHEHELSGDLYSEAIGYHLTLSVLKKVTTFSRSNLLNSRTFFGFLLRKALSVPANSP